MGYAFFNSFKFSAPTKTTSNSFFPIFFFSISEYLSAFEESPEFDEALSYFPDASLVSLSNAHRNLFKKAKPKWVVYNGIDTDLYKPGPKKEGYLLWLGRLGRAKDASGKFQDVKGIRWAIELAEKTEEKLLLSGNVEDPLFFEQDVRPHLSDKIQWMGPISNEQSLRKEEVVSLMQKAKTFLMTVNWEEPFGLVMAEAMACGTPVISFNRGSVSEIVIDGKTGFVVDPEEGVEGLKKALFRIDTIKREDCRKHIEENFTIDKMVDNYEKLYRQLL